MTIKNVFLFALLSTLLIIGGCKKNCSFPERQDGNKCWEIRNDLIGIYYGKKGIYNPDNQGEGGSFQQIQQQVGSYSDDKTGITVGALKGTFDDSLHIVFADQPEMLNGQKPYHVNGTGAFSDTLLYGKPNKMLSIDLNYTADNDSQIISGAPKFKLLFTGIR